MSSDLLALNQQHLTLINCGSYTHLEFLLRQSQWRRSMKKQRRASAI